MDVCIPREGDLLTGPLGETWFLHTPSAMTTGLRMFFLSVYNSENKVRYNAADVVV